MHIKKTHKYGDNGFGHILIVVILAIVIVICLAVYSIIAKHSSKQFLFGPQFPDIAIYHNVDKSIISNNNASAISNLNQTIKDFASGNPSLSYVGQDMFDGCGLFVTESNGDFAKAYGKMCGRDVIAYYSSVLDSKDVTTSTAKWFNTSFFQQSDVENGYLHLCGEYLISEHEPIEMLDIYTLDDNTAKQDTIFCNQLSKIDTTESAFTAMALVGGAIGADTKYQETRSQSNINRQEMVEKLKAKGAKTLVSVTLRKNYYKRTLH